MPVSCMVGRRMENHKASAQTWRVGLSVINVLFVIGDNDNMYIYIWSDIAEDCVDAGNRPELGPLWMNNMEHHTVAGTAAGKLPLLFNALLQVPAKLSYVPNLSSRSIRPFNTDAKSEMNITCSTYMSWGRLSLTVGQHRKTPAPGCVRSRLSQFARMPEVTWILNPIYMWTQITFVYLYLPTESAAFVSGTSKLRRCFHDHCYATIINPRMQLKICHVSQLTRYSWG